MRFAFQVRKKLSRNTVETLLAAFAKVPTEGGEGAFRPISWHRLVRSFEIGEDADDDDDGEVPILESITRERIHMCPAGHVLFRY